MQQAVDLLELNQSGSGYIPGEEAPKIDMELFEQITGDEYDLANQDAPLEDRINISPVSDGLSIYIRGCYEEARRSRYEEGIDDRLLESQRQYTGIYNPNEMQLINAQGGSTNFRKLTMTKCDAALSWISDILRPTRS